MEMLFNRFVSLVWRLAHHPQSLLCDRRTAQRAREELARVEAGRGARFQLRPEPHTAAAPCTPERRTGRRRGSCRVLVVSVNAEMQHQLPSMLAACLSRPEVRVRAMALDAVDELGRFRPDLLVVNPAPGECSSIEFLHCLRETRPELPVLVYTADEEALQRAHEIRREAGLRHLTVLQKTPAADGFVHTVPRLLRRRASDALRAEEQQPRQEGVRALGPHQPHQHQQRQRRQEDRVYQ
ncbi:MAG: hypothetical protein AB1430_03970 [Pseudomonadota bacterium]